MNGPVWRASGAGAQATGGSAEPRSRVGSGLGAERRFIASAGRNGAQRSGGPVRVGVASKRGTMMQHSEERILSTCSGPWAVRRARCRGLRRRTCGGGDSKPAAPKWATARAAARVGGRSEGPPRRGWSRRSRRRRRSRTRLRLSPSAPVPAATMKFAPFTASFARRGTGGGDRGRPGSRWRSGRSPRRSSSSAGSGACPRRGPGGPSSRAAPACR